jgi:CRISPR-associated protein Cmr4
MTNHPFKIHRCVIETLDPVHVGTGGYRLGRVDNSIIREPGTHLPKIPGTSLSGAVRQYAAYRYNKRRCSGQGGHCGDSSCPICYTFGTANESGGGYAGVISVGDARLLLFPVYSMVGPVWVTSETALSDFGASGALAANEEQAYFSSGLTGSHLNLGWMMVAKTNVMELTGLPDNLPDLVKQRIVLVSEKVFSQVVNSNLEVRTSVSIEAETGAAKEGALFTYEALPRAAYLWMDVVEDDYRDGKPWMNGGIQHQFAKNGQGAELGETWDSAIKVFCAGLKWAEYLGLGGMGTRGFGRVRLVNEAEVQK